MLQLHLMQSSGPVSTKGTVKLLVIPAP